MYPFGPFYLFKSIMLTCPSVAGFIFDISPFLPPLQMLLLNNGWGDPLSLFGHRPRYLPGPFYPFKSTILTYPSVAGFIFDISPFSPVQKRFLNST